jgi:hypothetical protein
MILEMSIDTIVLIALSVVLLVCVLASFLCGSLESSVLCFFFAALSLAMILILLGNLLLGFVILVIYSSLSSILLITTKIVDK